MRQVYERLIEMVEAKDVTPESDQVLMSLGDEMNSARCGPALAMAADFLVKDPSADPGPLARLKRLYYSLGLHASGMIDERFMILGFFLLDEMRQLDAA